MHQFSDKTNNFKFLDPNLPKNGFWSRNFKNLSLDFESASLRYNMHQFSDKTNNFEFLDPNLPQKWILESEFQNSKPGFGICISKIPLCTNFQTKWTILSFLALICPKMDFRVKISKI